MAISPTQRSLKLMRGEGYLCAITEHWNHFAKIRQDLFGFIDILAIKGEEVVAIQTTTQTNQSARVKKILQHKNFQAIHATGWKIVVHGWRKLKKTKKWECKIVLL